MAALPGVLGIRRPEWYPVAGSVVCHTSITPWLSCFLCWKKSSTFAGLDFSYEYRSVRFHGKRKRGAVSRASWQGLFCAGRLKHILDVRGLHGSTSRTSTNSKNDLVQLDAHTNHTFKGRLLLSCSRIVYWWNFSRTVCPCRTRYRNEQLSSFCYVVPQRTRPCFVARC